MAMPTKFDFRAFEVARVSQKFWPSDFDRDRPRIPSIGKVLNWSLTVEAMPIVAVNDIPAIDSES